MNNLTLVIPAKKEKESLPQVLYELKEYKLKILVILEESDRETIESINNFDCNIIYQSKKGYGNALIEGINKVDTKYFCIFNADGSFNPAELKSMYEKITFEHNDIVFSSRYEKGCSSEDDTIVTYIGNFIFTKLGNLFFKLKITDILYTFVMGDTEKIKNLNLNSQDFVFCIELPIKSQINNLKIATSKSNERARIGGKKKVNAIRDGFYILIGLIKIYFNKL